MESCDHARGTTHAPPRTMPPKKGVKRVNEAAEEPAATSKKALGEPKAKASGEVVIESLVSAFERNKRSTYSVPGQGRRRPRLHFESSLGRN